jgi:hypothetical protein
MASSSKKRQTFAKINRERELAERRARKQEKRESRRQAAAEAADPARDGAAADAPPSSGDE